MHKDLFSISKRAKPKYSKDYDKAVKQQSYEIREEVDVFNILGLTYKGRNLRPLWFGL